MPTLHFLRGYALLTCAWTTRSNPQGWVLFLGIWNPTFWYVWTWPRRAEYFLGFDLYGLGPLLLVSRLPS